MLERDRTESVLWWNNFDKQLAEINRNNKHITSIRNSLLNDRRKKIKKKK